jgi:hypothetical protein
VIDFKNLSQTRQEHPPIYWFPGPAGVDTDTELETADDVMADDAEEGGVLGITASFTVSMKSSDWCFFLVQCFRGETRKAGGWWQ